MKYPAPPSPSFRRCVVCTLALVLAVFQAGCAGWPTPQTRVARFDASHGEIFSVFGASPLDYTEFGRMMNEAGFKVIEEGESLSPSSLASVRLLVIAGPTRPLEEAEVKAVNQFVLDGGRLLVLLHIAPPVARLTESFNIFVSNFVISEKDNSIAGQSQDFYVMRFAEHALADGLSRMAVYGTWGLLAEDPAKVIAETSADAWVDLDRDGKVGAEEPRQAFGIIATAQPGQGRVVVVADDAPFATRFLAEADNRVLAKNILQWLK